MAGDKPRIYVDACVFIAMLTGEQRKGNESLHVAGFALEIERREVIAVTSAITKIEILECTLTDQQKNVMQRLLRPPKTQLKDVTTPIMDLTAEIRNFYQAAKMANQTNLPTVETPDAIHLATAIYYECPTMFTFDENDHSGGKNPKRALIPLSGVVAGRYPLIISKPISSATGLGL